MPTEFERRLNEARDALDSQDAEALAKVVTAYRKVYDDINASIAELEARMQTLDKLGIAISETLLHTDRYLRVSSSRLLDLIKQFDTEAASIINDHREAAVELGLDSAQGLLQVIFDEAGVPAETTINFLKYDEGALKQIVMRSLAQENIQTILNANEVQAFQSLRQIFVKAIVLGEPARVAAQALTENLGYVPFRAETTARTEIISAYRNANLERYKDSKVVEQWEWSATLDERTCPICFALDGKRFDLDVPFATHPNCRCAPIPVTATFESLGLGFLPEPEPPIPGLRGEDFFRSKSSSFQRRVFGNQKMFDLYSSGVITLDDLIHEYDHSKYGPSRDVRSVKQLRLLGIVP